MPQRKPKKNQSLEDLRKYEDTVRKSLGINDRVPRAQTDLVLYNSNVRGETKYVPWRTPIQVTIAPEDDYERIKGRPEDKANVLAHEYSHARSFGGSYPAEEPLYSARNAAANAFENTDEEVKAKLRESVGGSSSLFPDDDAEEYLARLQAKVFAFLRDGDVIRNQEDADRKAKELGVARNDIPHFVNLLKATVNTRKSPYNSKLFQALLNDDLPQSKITQKSDVTSVKSRRKKK